MVASCNKNLQGAWIYYIEVDAAKNVRWAEIHGTSGHKLYRAWQDSYMQLQVSCGSMYIENVYRVCETCAKRNGILW